MSAPQHDIAPTTLAAAAGLKSPASDPAPAPVHITFPGGAKRAVLLSPILPEWDEGAYFAPLLPVLAGAGYSTTIYDTLSLVATGTGKDADFTGLVEDWRTVLAAAMPADLVGGAALGGTVMQALLGMAPIMSVKRALFISAPSVVDPALSAALDELARLAREKGAGASLAHLADLVRREGDLVRREGDLASSPEGSLSGEIGPQNADAAGRLAAGFSLLCGADVSPALSAYPGHLMHVVGEASRMVVARNVRVFDPARQSTFLVPRAGMRPLTDCQDIVARHVRGFLSGS